MAESNINIIKSPLIEQGKKDKQEVQTSSQSSIIDELKDAATKFLEQIDTIITSANNLKNKQDNTEAIQNHQMNLKEYYNNYVDAIRKKHNQLKGAKNKKEKQELVKNLYQKMIIFQNKVNQIVKQFPVTTFIITVGGQEFFVKFDEKMDQFYEHISINTETGDFKYNISEKFINEIMKNKTTNVNIVKNLKELLTTEGTNIYKTQNEGSANQKAFAIKFSQMLKNADQMIVSLKKDTTNAVAMPQFISQILKNDEIKQELLLVPGRDQYRSADANKTIARQHIKNVQNELRKIGFEIKIKGNHENDDRYALSDVILTNGIQSISLHEILNSKEVMATRSLSFKVFAMHDKMSNPKSNEDVYHLFSLYSSGSQGWLKEAFFGAYFGLEAGKKNNNLEKFNLESYYNQLDTIKGRLTGDYSTTIDGKKYEIQIKAGNAQVTIFQFIELAYYIKITPPNEIKKTINRFISEDRQSQSENKGKRALYLYDKIRDEAFAKAEEVLGDKIKIQSKIKPT